MFTLLPEQQKKKLFRQYRTRLTVVFLVFLSSFFAFNIALLFPSYISLRSEKLSYENEYADLSKRIESKDKQGLTPVMNQVQSDVMLADPDRTDVYRAINLILDHTTTNISLLSLNYIRGSKSDSTLTIQGVARERSDLIMFSNNLKKELLFTSVDLPISNLAKQSDSKFNITLTGKF